MWRDIIIAVLSITIAIAGIIWLAPAQACEKDDCDRRMDKYTSCITWHGEKKCRPIKRVMERTCGLRK